MKQGSQKQGGEIDWIEEYFKDKANAKAGSELWEMGESEAGYNSPLMKKIICKDGFEMSVQAGHGLYCTPRVTLLSSKYFIYRELEVGYPSRKESLLMEWCEDRKRPTETVYGYVPVEVINKVITKHGGIK